MNLYTREVYNKLFVLVLFHLELFYYVLLNHIDNLSPLDSNIACLCQNIEINNNKHILYKSGSDWTFFIWWILYTESLQ